MQNGMHLGHCKKNPTGAQGYRWDFFREQGEKIPSVTSLRLVFRSQQIVDGLHRVERADGNFNEDSVPVAHGTVPKSGQLQRLEFSSVLAFSGDKSRVVVHEIR